MPSKINDAGQEVGATVAVLGSILGMLRDGATHLAVATDQVIESFRNELWPNYKAGNGIAPALFSQFSVLEEALEAMGVVVWAMREFEADDAMASGAVLAAADSRVTEVLLCTPDKDLAQCVRGDRVVQLDRRRRIKITADGVWKKFGVAPESIPDYLALTGDSADGFPGLPGWGAKSASVVLAHYQRIERIPDLATEWEVEVRGAARLAATLAGQRPLALLFRQLATLVCDAPIAASVDELEWHAPNPDFEAVTGWLAAPGLAAQARELIAGRE